MLATVPLLLLPAGCLLTSRRNGVAAALLCHLGIGIQILGVTVNYSYIHWDWLRMNLNPVTAYLFVPELSPVPTHLRALLANRHVDLWLMEVYKQFGGGVLAITLALPAGIVAVAVALLRDWQWRRWAERLREAVGGERSAAQAPTAVARQ